MYLFAAVLHLVQVVFFMVLLVTEINLSSSYRVTMWLCEITSSYSAVCETSSHTVNVLSITNVKIIS